MLMIPAGVNQMKRAFVFLLLMVVASAFAGDKTPKIERFDWATQFDQDKIIIMERPGVTREKFGFPSEWWVLLVTTCNKETGDRIYMSVTRDYNITAMTVVPKGCKP